MSEAANFTDGKAADALRTIGEVARALNIRQHVLRYWEEQFPMLRPLKRSGGRRLYRAEDVQLIAAIDRLVHREGYTLKGARAALQGGEKSAAMQFAAPPTTDITAQLGSIRNSLAAALAA